MNFSVSSTGKQGGSGKVGGTVTQASKGEGKELEARQRKGAAQMAARKRGFFAVKNSSRARSSCYCLFSFHLSAKPQRFAGCRWDVHIPLLVLS